MKMTKTGMIIMNNTSKRTATKGTKKTKQVVDGIKNTKLMMPKGTTIIMGMAKRKMTMSQTRSTIHPVNMAMAFQQRAKRQASLLVPQTMQQSQPKTSNGKYTNLHQMPATQRQRRTSMPTPNSLTSSSKIQMPSLERIWMRLVTKMRIEKQKG